MSVFTPTFPVFQSRADQWNSCGASVTTEIAQNPKIALENWDWKHFEFEKRLKYR